MTVPAGTEFDLEAQSFSGALESNAPITVRVAGRGDRTVELTTGATWFTSRGRATAPQGVVVVVR